MYRQMHRKILTPLLLAALAVPAGCSRELPPRPVVSRYPQLPAKAVPGFLQGTILERVDLAHTDYARVSGYGLVVNLDRTGDGSAPNAIRQYIVKEMERKGYGMRDESFNRTISPEQVLADPRTAIVRVDGFVPPGARKGQRFDVQVSALPGSQTSSLAGGTLYTTALQPLTPFGDTSVGPEVDLIANAAGPVFVNPAYALAPPPDPTVQTGVSTGGSAPVDRNKAESLRYGIAMDGGLLRMDRPLALRVRQPSRSVARMIQARLQEQYQDKSIAEAHDEGLVYVRVPAQYGDDWEHAAGVMQHVFFSTNTGFVAAKAKQLADLAAAPDAPLLDISYCWEALGPNALPFYSQLMTSPSPDVAYAASRAAAFVGDRSAQDALLAMAGDPKHPFRLNAVQTLAALPPTPAVDQLLRNLLDSDETLVRVAAYQGLVRNNDPAIISHPVGDKFVLDTIPSEGPPLIYASSRGTPRIAVFGRGATLKTPIAYGVMDDRLTITSDPNGGPALTIYQQPARAEPVVVRSNPDLAELIARLGGMGPEHVPALELTYGQIVAMLQDLGGKQRVVALADGRPTPAVFVLQNANAGGTQDAIYAAPVPAGDTARPTGGAAPQPARTEDEFLPPRPAIAPQTPPADSGPPSPTASAAQLR